MEQTVLSLNRSTSPKPNHHEQSKVAKLGSLEVHDPEMGSTWPPINEQDPKLECFSSQVGSEYMHGCNSKQDIVAAGQVSVDSHSPQSDADSDILTLNVTKVEKTNTVLKDEGDNNSKLDLNSADPTQLYQEDCNSFSQNSDAPHAMSEGECSNGKDERSFLMTDVSKYDSTEKIGANVTDQIKGEEALLDSGQKETTFMDGVITVSESDTTEEEMFLKRNDPDAEQAPDLNPEKQKLGECSEKLNSKPLMPTHFQKNVRGPELCGTPPKKMQKRKTGSSKLCAPQTIESDWGNTNSHLVPNGQCKSKATTRIAKGFATEEQIGVLYSVSSNKGQREEIKNDRVSIFVGDSDCESETSSSSENSICWLERFRFIRKHLLTLAMALSMIFGVILGSCLRASISSKDHHRITYLRFPGDLFVNTLHMLAIPLTLSALVSTLASMDSKSLRKLGLRSLFYYSVTTFIAIVTGIILAMTAQPGKFDQLSGTGGPVPKVNPVDAVLDLLRNIFPDNIIVACFKKFITQQVKITKWHDVTSTSSWNLIGTSEYEQTSLQPGENIMNVESNSTGNNDKYSTPVTMALLPEAIIQVNSSEFYQPVVTQIEGTNFLGLVLASVVMGAVISSMGPQGRLLQDFFGAFSIVTIKVTRIIMLYSPVGIFFLVAAKVVEVEFPQITFYRLLMYTITVLVGLLGQGFLILPLVYFLMTRKNPLPFMYGISQGIITALATSSSAATLPIMLRCLEQKNQVSSQVARFVAPVGSVINLNGSALYQAMACIFIAQHRAVDMTISQMALMSSIVTLASIGSACVPQSGLLSLVAVLTSVGLPPEDAALILTVDWILDRFSTMVNVIGDAIGAGLIHQMATKEEARRKRL